MYQCLIDNEEGVITTPFLMLLRQNKVKKVLNQLKNVFKNINEYFKSFSISIIY